MKKSTLIPILFLFALVFPGFIFAQEDVKICKITLERSADDIALSAYQIISAANGTYMTEAEADLVTKLIMKDFSDEWYHSCGVTLFFLKDNIPYKRRLLLCRNCLSQNNGGSPPHWFKGPDWEIAKSGMGYGQKYLRGIFVFKQ